MAKAFSRPSRAWQRMLSGRRLDLLEVATLSFEAPDPVRFPALRLARAALDAGGGASVVLNAANEIAVEAFLAGHIHFGDIAAIVERLLDEMHAPIPTSIPEVLALDAAVRARARAALTRIAA